MTWSDDPELQEMFVGEVAERSAILANGARTLRNGDMTPQIAGELLREGHTIKGTGRVMGYDHVATAGEMLEMIWRWIQRGDITPLPIFGRILEGLSNSLPGALTDPGQLDEAMAAVLEYFEGEELPDELPRPPSAAPMPDKKADLEVVDDEPESGGEGSGAEEPASEASQKEESNDDETVEDDAEEEPDPAASEEQEDDSEEGESEPKTAGDEPEPEPSEEKAKSEPSVPTTEQPPSPPSLKSSSPPEEQTASVIEFPTPEGGVAVAEKPSPGPRGEGEVDEALADLGGLIASVQDWAAEEIINVNAGRLYGLVNHLVTMRIDVDALKAQLGELGNDVAADPFFAERVAAIEQAVDPIAEFAESLETEGLQLASVPLTEITGTLPQLVSYLAKKTGNEVRLDIRGDDILIDRQVVDMLDDAVRQLVVNGVVHGIEDAATRVGVEKTGAGVISVVASEEDTSLKLVVTDDGRGIDWNRIRDKAITDGLIDGDAELAPDRMRALLYQDGFSTLEEVGELAGDGMGLGLVRDAVEALNGSFRVESVPHKRTSVTITVPVHRAMQRALLVVSGAFTWGIPAAAVEEVIPMSAAAITVTDDATVIRWDEQEVPFGSFADVVGFTTSRLPTQVVVVSSSVGQVALAVEGVLGTRQVAAKELGALLAGSETVIGAALLGGDEVALVVDTASLVERQRRLAADGPSFSSPRVLIVDDSLGVQQVVSSALATSGFMTSVAGSVADALGSLQSESFDALVVDFSMPRADGVALVHMVRQRHANTPIVMLSGVADEADVERAKQAGVDAFFDKSDFREGGLAEKLHELIAERREEEQTA